MASKKKPPEPQTGYQVCSAITGAVVCGPYIDQAAAATEKDRLNKEAITGLAANGDELTPDRQPIRHDGKAMRYEVVTVEGVILAEA